MARIDTLLDKLCMKPTPADFRFSDLRKIMDYFGYLESNKGATSGSRVKFYHPETQAVLLLHKPHPQKELKAYQIKQLVEKLEQEGLI